MEPRKQNVSAPKEGTGGAAKTAAGRKQSATESSASPAQDTSPNQGTSANQGGSSPNQGTTMNQGGSSPNQGASSMNQGASPMNQGASSMNQGANQSPTGENAGDQNLLQHAKQATGAIASKVQEQAGSQLARQKESAATDLSHIVEAVRRFGEGLAGEENGPIARYAAQYGDKAASSLERLTTYIREQDPKQLLGDVQKFGRRRPALLLGGAFLLGFAGARLIRSAMDAESHQAFDADVPGRRPSTVNVPGATPLTKKVPAATPSTTNVNAGGPSTSPNAL